MNHPHIAQRQINAAGPKLLVDRHERLLGELFRPYDVRAVGRTHPQTKLPGIHGRKNVPP